MERKDGMVVVGEQERDGLPERDVHFPRHFWTSIANSARKSAERKVLVDLVEVLESVFDS